MGYADQLFDLTDRVILITGGLIFLPSLALGPIVEHFSMLAGTTY